jgi:ribosomal protein L37AE/L43A
MRFCPEAKRFHERKKAKTNNIVATKALAHKLARACYHILKEGKPFDSTRCFACGTTTIRRATYGDWTTTTCTELDAGSPSPAAVTADRPHRKPSGDWRRHAGSHGSVEFFWMRGVPTFFWGGHAARAQASLGPMLDPDGCLARPVMRTQPSTEETGAVRTRTLERNE